MMRRLHGDIHGKVNVVHFIILAVVVAALYFAIKYYPPWIQFVKIKSAAETTALQGSTVEYNDDRNKAFYDGRMKDIGVEYPLSEHLTYHRYDMDTVEVAFEYEYPIKHFWTEEPHVLQYSFHCKAHRGHCQD